MMKTHYYLSLHVNRFLCFRNLDIINKHVNVFFNSTEIYKLGIINKHYLESYFCTQMCCGTSHSGLFKGASSSKFQKLTVFMKIIIIIKKKPLRGNYLSITAATKTKHNGNMPNSDV